MTRYNFRDYESGLQAIWYPHLRQWHVGEIIDGRLNYDRFMSDCAVREYYEIEGVTTAKKIVEGIKKVRA